MFRFTSASLRKYRINSVTPEGEIIPSFTR